MDFYFDFSELQTPVGLANDFQNLKAAFQLSRNLDTVLPALNATVSNLAYMQALLQLGSVIGLALDIWNSASSQNASSSQQSAITAANSCWQRFDAVMWIVLAGLLMIPIMIALSFTVKREQQNLDCCNGRPGVAYPWETLKYTRGRGRYALTILLLCYPTYMLITESSAIFGILTPSTSWATTPLKLACILVIGISLHPIFFSITQPCLLTVSVGFAVSTYYAVIVMLPTILCAQFYVNNLLAVLLQLAFALPTMIAAVCVSVMQIIDGVQAIRADRWLQPTSVLLNRLYTKYYISKQLYVKNLLARHAKSEKVAITSATEMNGDYEQKNLAIGNERLETANGSNAIESPSKEGKLKSLWSKIKYRSIDGFYYPCALMCSFSASIVLIYYMVLLSIAFALYIQNWVNTNWFQPFHAYLGDKRSIEQVFSDVITNEKLNWSLVLRPVNLIPLSSYCFDTLIYVLIAGSVLATLNGLIVLLLMFLSYRTNTITAYAGVYKDLTHRVQIPAGSAVVGQCRYGGYQIAYCAWALFMQFFVYSILLCIVWYGILMPIAFRYKPWYYGMLLYDWPSLLISCILAIVQSYVPNYAFVAHKGTQLGIKHRTVFLVWNYYSFFISSATGLLSCFLRLIYSFVVAFVFLSRLDWCSLPSKFRFLDGGHAAYLGQLITDVYHSHPVVITFVESAKQAASITNLGQHCASPISKPHLHSITSISTDFNAASSCSLAAKAESESASTASSIESSRDQRIYASRSRAMRRKWLVAFTLVRNPALQLQRRPLHNANSAQTNVETAL